MLRVKKYKKSNRSMAGKNKPTLVGLPLGNAMVIGLSCFLVTLSQVSPLNNCSSFIPLCPIFQSQCRAHGSQSRRFLLVYHPDTFMIENPPTASTHAIDEKTETQ